MDFKKAELEILDLLEDGLDKKLHYHGFHHTLEVITSVEKLAPKQGIDGQELQMLRLAAAYHDSGFLEVYKDHETVGCNLVNQLLPKHDFTKEKIDYICTLIESTRLPQSPKCLLGKILCDADLDYLGRENYTVVADSLRRELTEYNLIQDEEAWLLRQIAFLQKHSYFLADLNQDREEVKQNNLKTLINQYTKQQQL